MKIDGKHIAQDILDDLRLRVETLEKKGIIPHLVIILIGNDPASQAYVRQKELKGNEIGAKITIKHLPPSLTQGELLQLLNDLNHLTSVHGLIVQRPLPDQIDEKIIDEAVIPQKDVDGFHPQTKFQMPLAAAVLKILKDVFLRSHLDQGATFTQWLQTKSIVIIGKGETGGGPVISALAKLGVKPLIIDSKTPNPQKATKNADIIICAVGKPHMITADKIKKGSILISIGMHKEDDGKLHGDYQEDDIKDVAGFYTPTPGGVGPVNVAMLLENVVTAAQRFAA